MIVWSGAAVMATAATAGTILALRHIADRIFPSAPADKRKFRPRPIPRGPAAERTQSLHSAHPEPKPAKPQRRTSANAKPRKRPLVEEIEDTSHRLTSTVGHVSTSLAAAVTGFARLASQTRNIVQDFGDVADLIRATIVTQQATKPSAGPTPDLKNKGDG